jgi:hypothetical protein
MKLTSLVTVVAILSTCTVWAEEDLSRSKALYKEINEKLASYAPATGSVKVGDTSYTLKGWLEGDQVRKIEATAKNAERTYEELYLEQETPRFVLSTHSQLKEQGKAGPRVEERIYFADGSIVKWLTTAKPTPVLSTEDYARMKGVLTKNCAAFVAALKKGKLANAAKVETLEGTFTGIEQGDYFYWKMRTAVGEERSFFILRPEDAVSKVADEPKAFIGKRCRIRWKTSTELIPEANERIEVEQILNVEWLPKK